MSRDPDHLFSGLSRFRFRSPFKLGEQGTRY